LPAPSSRADGTPWLRFAQRLCLEAVTVQQAISAASPPIARRDAETLLLHLLRQGRAWLFTHADEELGEELRVEFFALVARRAAREPLQYLTDTQEFYGLALKVTPATLIPRPETELLVEAVLAWAAQQPQPVALIDVGTGTGAIALAIAAHLPQAQVVACAVAQQNALSLGLEWRVRFAESDLLAAYGGVRFDVVVSNPPYIPAGDAAEMQPEVRDFEPHTALFAGSDGLEVYRRLIPQAKAALRPGGLLAMEFGYGQREALAELLTGWEEVRFLDDYAGIPRVVLATSG
jgi:release factor glutamine methyltransferase